MDNDFYKVDLHIHTPASSCYKGEKTDEEYLRILEKAKTQKLKVIAITDHNTIEGYKKILKIKSDLLLKKDNLDSITDSKQAKLEIEEVKNKLILFDNILILPGIEFEVRNNVHMLIIFNPDTPLNTIERFLYEGGYDEISFGKENPLTLANWDVIELYNNLKKHNCIVIDAHTDVNKGMFKVIQPGSYRANCFKSDCLQAIGYRNEKQKNILANILKNSKEYKRNTPIAFVKFSDSHSLDEVGTYVTWFKLDKINFDNIKLALNNPTEKISTEIPSLNKILNRIFKEEIVFGVINFSDESKKYFMQAICALNNSKGGYCLFGVDSNNNKVGISLEYTSEDQKRKEIGDSLKKILECVKEIVNNYSLKNIPRISVYPIQNKKVIFSIKINKSDELISIEGEGIVYSIHKNKIIILSADEVQKLIEERTVNYLRKKIQYKIDNIQNECNMLLNTFDSIQIIKKFEHDSVRLSSVIHKPLIRESIKINKDDKIKLQNSVEKYPNGIVRGNIISYDSKLKARLERAYLRYSTPLYCLKTKQKITNSEFINILPGGQVFYSKKDYPFYSDFLPCILKIESHDEKYFSNIFITCFLKSSFWLWYALNKFSSFDLYSPKIFRCILLPKVNSNPEIKKIIELIEINFKKIIELEKIFLINTNKTKGLKRLGHIIEEHNKTIDELAYNIDKNIYKLCRLSDNDIRIIENYLKNNNIYLPVFEESKLCPTETVVLDQ